MFQTANKITGPLSRRMLAQQPRVLSQRPVARVISRPLSSTWQLQARKDAQDKDSLKPEPNEYSKSGSDDEAARVSDTAFNPNKTSPEEQHDSAGAEAAQLGQASNPLNVSPANKEVSKPRGDTEGGHEGSAASSSDSPSDRARSSGGGSPSKGSKGQKYSS